MHIIYIMIYATRSHSYTSHDRAHMYNFTNALYTVKLLVLVRLHVVLE